ncbi:MAG: hypothetical protein QW275_00915 [Candidatus Anstonellaceae archaeon]
MSSEDELVDFILKSRQKMRSDEQIRNALLSVGWKKEKVEQAFKLASEKQKLPPTPSNEPPPYTDKPSPSLQTKPDAQAQPNIAQVKEKQSNQSSPSTSPAPPIQIIASTNPPQSSPTTSTSTNTISPASPQPAPSSTASIPSQTTSPLSPPLQPPASPPITNMPQQPPTSSSISQSSPSQQPQSSPAPSISPQQPSFSPLPKPNLPAFLPQLLVAAVLLVAAGAAYYFLAFAPSNPFPIAQEKPDFANLPPVSSPPEELQNQSKMQIKPIPPAEKSTMPPAANNSNKTDKPKEEPLIPPEKNVTNNSSAALPENPQIPVPPPNLSKPSALPSNNSSTSAVQNQTNLTSSSQQNTSKNLSSNLTNQTEQFPVFKRVSVFRSSAPFYPDAYCNQYQDGGTFVRAHMQYHYGGDCTNPNPNKQGFVNISVIKSQCQFIPCCINGPYKEWSISYDWFECGYNTERIVN